MKPTVVIHIDALGLQDVLICGDVDVFTVSELSPGDRVYQHSGQVEASEIADVIGDSPIGSRDDGRHEALAARIRGEGLTVLDGGKK
jgi:hypothetical protein